MRSLLEIPEQVSFCLMSVVLCLDRLRILALAFVYEKFVGLDVPAVRRVIGDCLLSPTSQ